MIALLERNHDLRSKLSTGLDVLIAPHHGLQSSFSTELFKSMKNGKTRCLNVISEKVNTEDNRNVDSRYSTADYCRGENNIGLRSEQHYQLKTSRGHIYIDYSVPTQLHVEVINDVNELINKFL